MIQRYLRRREDKEADDYPIRELEDVLGKAVDIPLFQEIAIVLTPNSRGIFGSVIIASLISKKRLPTKL